MDNLSEPLNARLLGQQAWLSLNRFRRVSAMLLIGGMLSACSGGTAPINPQFVRDDTGQVASSVKLSPERISEIRTAFTGRTVVFKEDWYEYNIIDTDPLGGFSEPQPVTVFPQWLKNRNYRVLAAPRGTVGTITGMRFYYESMTFIVEKEGGGAVYVSLRNHRPWTVMFGSRNSGDNVQRVKLSDKLNTLDWFRRNLTMYTLDFVDGLRKVPDAVMPEPEPERTLTPLPGRQASSTQQRQVPVVEALTVVADPVVVRNNGALNLLLEYTVTASPQAVTPVTEVRTLLFNGQVLPGYPRRSEERRGGGQHVSGFRLTVPAQASQGDYEFRGEVCIRDACISRVRSFRVVP
ncbi:MAG: hypothetical protein R3E84_03025 [Pseudomonadales bacterium]